MMRLAFLTIAAAFMMTLAWPAAADNDTSADREVKNRATAAELQALEAIQKRREFQQQQQINRELDRQPAQLVRPDVPIMQPGGVRR